MSSGAYVEMVQINKSFGSVQANQDVDLNIFKGEIHALLGENGSGKSTLMNMLSGIYRPDSGSIFLNNKKLEINSPRDAIQAGIGMVHQHFKLVEVMNATENIILGPDQPFWINKRERIAEIEAIRERYGLQVDLKRRIYHMSVGEKQSIEILKVLYRGAEVLILDEPTAVLTPQEIHVLFDIVRNMKREGCAVIIITHKLNEVLEISDKVTVLRRGASIATLNTAECNARQLAEMMVGRPIDLSIKRSPVNPDGQELLLRVKDLTVEDTERVERLQGIDFELFSGEILGIAGVAGSGQKELCEALAGLQTVKSGEIIFKGENLVGLNPRTIFRRGVSMSFVPEDRLGMGLVGAMDITNNVLLRDYQRMPGILMDRKISKHNAKQIVQQYEVATPSVNLQVKKLSGGNVQKVLLGREINSEPSMLITAYPVRGLDINASYRIYEILNQQKEQGVGILFIGEDLDVLLELCDRIMVINQGKVMGLVAAADFDKEEIGLMMMGHSPGEAMPLV